MPMQKLLTPADLIVRDVDLQTSQAWQNGTKDCSSDFTDQSHASMNTTGYREESRKETDFHNPNVAKTHKNCNPARPK